MNYCALHLHHQWTSRPREGCHIKLLSMESPGVSRIAAEEAWESEVLPASEAAPAPAESEVAPASPEGEAVPEPAEERPSMLSRQGGLEWF